MAELTRFEAEEFLYQEARLLDDGRFDEWLDLFVADAHYWVPCGNGADPDLATHLIYDDRTQLEDRVWQLQHPRRHSQSPPSLTVHLISNVEVGDASGPEPRVWASFVLSEVRRVQGGTGHQGTFAGRSEHLLRREDGQWRIALKKIWLVNRELPINNLTFLL